MFIFPLNKLKWWLRCFDRPPPIDSCWTLPWCFSRELSVKQPADWLPSCPPSCLEHSKDAVRMLHSNHSCLLLKYNYGSWRPSMTVSNSVCHIFLPSQVLVNSHSHGSPRLAGPLPLIAQWKVWGWCKQGPSFALKDSMIGADTLVTSLFWLYKQAVGLTFPVSQETLSCAAPWCCSIRPLDIRLLQGGPSLSGLGMLRLWVCQARP
jgi:hypothetical protein